MLDVEQRFLTIYIYILENGRSRFIICCNESQQKSNVRDRPDGQNGRQGETKQKGSCSPNDAHRVYIILCIFVYTYCVCTNYVL